MTIDYDNTVNSITVNGAVYYPGDSFVLDGQKVELHLELDLTHF